MKPIVFIYVNGILTFPGLSKNWNRRAVTWTHRHFARQLHKAESLEYLVSALTRPFWQRYRAEKLEHKWSHYLADDFDVVIAAHSNGADVVLDALRLYPRLKARALHLLAPAIPADCEANGINALLFEGRLGRVKIYRGGADWALHLASTIPGRLLGYGALGMEGPRNQGSSTWGRLELRSEPEFGHSTWFEPQHFHQTMEEITS